MSELSASEFEELKRITEEVVKALGFEATVSVVETHPFLPFKTIALSSDQDLRLLIGKNGQNLQALEHLVRRLAVKKIFQVPEFSLDINDYRQSKAQVIISQALMVAERVRETKKAEALFPMSAYERKLVHLGLASSPEVETESIGEEPQRRVVIRPIVL